MFTEEKRKLHPNTSDIHHKAVRIQTLPPFWKNTGKQRMPVGTRDTFLEKGHIFIEKKLNLHVNPSDTNHKASQIWQIFLWE